MCNIKSFSIGTGRCSQPVAALLFWWRLTNLLFILSSPMPNHHLKLQDWAAGPNDKTLLSKGLFVSAKSMSSLQHLVVKFEATGSLNKQPTLIHQRNALWFHERAQGNLRQSCRAQELGLSQTHLNEFYIGTWAYTRTGSNWPRS